MGVWLRSNIFRPGSREQQEYARFPIQATVLFSPNDRPFADAFDNLFPQLHRLTGQHIVFFAVLDNGSSRDPEPGTGPNNAVLVREIARLFRVPWQWFPCIVAATDLWTLETVVVPTSQSTVERQFRALTALAKDYGKPALDDIYDVLCTAGTERGSIQTADEGRRIRLSRLYEILESADFGHHDRLLKLVREEVDAVERSLNRLHRSSAKHGDWIDDSFTENIFADASGRLVAPAVAVNKRERPRGYELAPNLIEDLDDESRVMIQTGGLIADFFATEVSIPRQSRGL
jgi:hypothetical protein